MATNLNLATNEWAECTDSEHMVSLLVSTSCPDDTFRRIACAMVRRTPLADGRKVGDLLDNAARHILTVTERYVDGLATGEEMNNARYSHSRALAYSSVKSTMYLDTYMPMYTAGQAALFATRYDAKEAVVKATHYAARAAAITGAGQADIIREFVPDISLFSTNA